MRARLLLLLLLLVRAVSSWSARCDLSRCSHLVTFQPSARLVAQPILAAALPDAESPPAVDASISSPTAPDSCETELCTPEPPLPTPSHNAAANALILGSLLVTGAYLIVANDLSAIVSLYSTPDASIPAVAGARLEIVAELFRRLPADWIHWYDLAAISSPLPTKATTSAVCYFTGDLIAQALSRTPLADLDLARASRSAAAGFIGHGPLAHYWLELLDAHLSFGGAWWAALPKIIADQGPMSIVYNTVYTVLIGAFALTPPKQIIRDVRETWWPGMKASLKFWPAVHLITFSTLVPLELKLLWIDLMEIVWIAILSNVNSREEPGAPAEAEEKMSS